MKIIYFVLALVVSTTFAYADVRLDAAFNAPGFKGAKTTTVVDKLVLLIDQAAPEATLRMSMYEFDDMAVAMALLRASARGVDVQIVLDGRKNKSAAKKTGTAVNALDDGAQGLQALKCSTQNCITFCGGFLGGACRGSRNNHNKFYSISRLSDGTENVVAVSSANLNEGQLYWYNDLFITAGDARLRVGVDQYFAGLVNTELAVPLLIQGDVFSLYTFPNKQTDPVLDELSRVTCQLPGSKIRVIQSRFTDARVAVAKKLAQLGQAGCDVQVLARHE
ncbi:MAG: phospholipase D-like domain-containing protein, partial [Bdellovibrionota bacterium]